MASKQQIYISIENSIIDMLSCIATLFCFSNMVLVKSTFKSGDILRRCICVLPVGGASLVLIA